MQSSTLGSSFAAFPKLSSGAVYQRNLGLPLPVPARTGMDISAVLDQKRAAANEDQRRYHQSLQMNHGSAYGMSQDSTFPHQQQSMQQPNGLQYAMMASNQHSPPLYPPYMPRQDSQSSFGDENFTQTQPKSRAAAKQFPCTLEQAEAEVSANLSTGTTRPQDSPMYTSTSESSPGHADQISPVDEASPQTELPPMAIGMQRHNSDYGYSQQLPLPQLFRPDLQQSGSRTASPLNGHHLQNYTSAPQQRPVTSYPASYGPPQPLEPPANGTASGGASPYLGGWPSPSQGTLPPPIAMDTSAYHDSGFHGPSLGLNHMGNNQHGGHHLYYASVNGIGRPQSTEPKDYGLHAHQSQVSSQVSWNPDPLDASDHRQGGFNTWRNELPERPVQAFGDHKTAFLES
ncbi:hypothetical protein H2200_002633 [Cladophialophora chaetospira]|uniref:Uncharacterized protein n=1 Tax=Cladophialophora chaetospira TaxID=386627 RepID=A0AA39CMA5_9EURO|nr:hypothetical protein H2200_002633 [Cladophialophora chaetospira]